MKVQQRSWSFSGSWSASPAWMENPRTSLVLVFGPRQLMHCSEPITQVMSAFPYAQIVGCSTAGQILGTNVEEETLAFTAIEFERSTVRVVNTELLPELGSYQAGKQLATLLDDTELVHAFALSDGLHVNGSELVRGLVDHLPPSVAVTGGLAGDGAAFQQTLVHLNGKSAGNRAIAIGLYGSRLSVGFGSRGGWAPFGPERVITRSTDNVLFELDGECALSLYERYLGEHANNLPASALRFPLSIRDTLSGTGVVRTVLGIDQQKQSMTFAGDVREGTYARLMRADVDRLIDGASNAEKVAKSAMYGKPPELAILISCVGRKLVLKQRTEEEVEAVRDALSPETLLAGFYSYGEISPFGPADKSALHNQTMTVTTFAEAL